MKISDYSNKENDESSSFKFNESKSESSKDKKKREFKREIKKIEEHKKKNDKESYLRINQIREDIQMKEYEKRMIKNKKKWGRLRI